MSPFDLVVVIGAAWLSGLAFWVSVTEGAKGNPVKNALINAVVFLALSIVTALLA